MADEEENGGGGQGDPLFNAIGVLIVVLLAAQLIQNLPGILEEQFGGLTDTVMNFSSTTTYTVLYTASVVFSLGCLAGTIYASIQKSRIVMAEKRWLDSLTNAAISGEDTENERWQQILSYAASDDHELWRLAIIEADVMLDEMMETMGYTEDSLGDKLRNVEPSDFQTIDEAWEAHKMRNLIAHEGSTYDLKKEEVDRTIKNYQRVFEEFEYL